MVGVVGSNPIVPTNSKRVAKATLFFGLLVRVRGFLKACLFHSSSDFGLCGSSLPASATVRQEIR